MLKKLNTITIQAKKKSAAPIDVFTSYLSNNFPRKTQKVSARPFEVYEIEKDGTFNDFFPNPEKQAMTIGEITEFCKNHSDQLQKEWYTFFLFKDGSDFFVASVDVCDYGLSLGVYPLSDGYVWDARFQLHVVVPQLTLETLESPTLCPSDTLTLASAIQMVKDAGYKIIKEV